MKHFDKDLKVNINNNVVVYLDNHIIVADKKEGLLTQPTDTVKKSLQEDLKSFLKKKYEKKGDVFLHAVHRLDKDVSGLVLFARTSKALSRLNDQMRDKKIKKKYIAKIEGYLEEREKRLQFYIAHKSHKAKVSKDFFENSKIGVLAYKVISEEKSFSKVEIDLMTGRYHQIRAFFAFIGHPILGDRKYGSSKQLDHIELRCTFLEFIHPTLKNKMTLKIS